MRGDEDADKKSFHIDTIGTQTRLCGCFYSMGMEYSSGDLKSKLQPASLTEHKVEDCDQNVQRQVFREDRNIEVEDQPSSIDQEKRGDWRACSFILVAELLERFSHHGISANLITYLTTELHMSTASAAREVNNFQGATALVPIVGGFVADAYWGRYMTSMVGCIFYSTGLFLLTAAVMLPGKVNIATRVQAGVFFGALYVTALGLAATTPCFEAFGADQFEEGNSKGRRRKSSFFNWWYFAVSIGSLAASAALVYVQDSVGWGLGYGIPCATMLAATLSLAAGSPFYVRKPPGGSPITLVAQVLVASLRKWRLPHDVDESLLFELPSEEHLRHGRRRLLPTKEFRFLDKAAIVKNPSSLSLKELSHPIDSTTAPLLLDQADDPSIMRTSGTGVNPWRLCTVTQVEEVKLVLRIIPIVLAILVYGASHAQAATFFTRQGRTLDGNVLGFFTIAPASMLLFSSVSCLVAVPLYDRLLVPAARRVTGNERGITLLQRIGVGMGLTAVGMAVAAGTEAARLHVARVNGLVDDPSGAELPMSILWLVPQYVMMGVANVFAVVGKQEFFYDQMPDAMRSLGLALYLLSNGAGAYLSSILISAVDAISTRYAAASWFSDNLNRAHLDYFYWFLAVLTVANLGVYVMVSKNYTYKRAENAASSG